LFTVQTKAVRCYFMIFWFPSLQCSKRWDHEHLITFFSVIKQIYTAFYFSHSHSRVDKQSLQPLQSDFPSLFSNLPTSLPSSTSSNPSQQHQQQGINSSNLSQCQQILFFPLFCELNTGIFLNCLSFFSFLQQSYTF
jgi:hypothetical protein